MPRSQKPTSRDYQLLKTVVEDIQSRALPLSREMNRQKYSEAMSNINMKYKFIPPKSLSKDMNDKVYEAYVNIIGEVAEEIVRKYKEYVRKANAVARGENNPNSLINALEIVQDSSRRTRHLIYVVNRAWLYQEYGFNMRGQLPPREVALKILQWAIDKGIVMVLRSRRESETTSRGRKRYKMALRQRQSRYYERVDVEMVEEEDMEDAKESFMWYITKLVVNNNSGRNNRRLFLTTAYWNTVSDKMYIQEIQRKWFKEYRVITK